MFTKVKSYLTSLLSKILPKRDLSRTEKRELLLTSVNPKKEKRARILSRKLAKPDSYKSIYEYFVDHDEFNGILKESLTNIQNSPSVPKKTKASFAQDYGSYRDTDKVPAGSGLYDLFFNPFSIYSYLHKNHPVVYRCIDIIREELANDGFVIKSAKATPKKRVKEVYNLLKKHKIPRLRLEIASHLKLYGNAWLMRTKPDKKTKTEGLQLLSPSKVKPIVDQITKEIIGWRVFRGETYRDYGLDEVYHLWLMNSDIDQRIGDPPLQTALLDIETDLAMKVFNKEIVETGFLGSVVFEMETPGGADPWEDDAEDIVEDLTNKINNQLSGAKGGGKALVITGSKDVKNINPVGKIEGAFIDMSREKAKLICLPLGIPSEKLSINRSESVQYVPSFIEYSVNASFDKSINCLASTVDEFLSEVYIQEVLGYKDLKIESGGRFGSLTKTAADVIKVLSDSGPIITVNQALELILGWEGLHPSNPRGNWVLDNTQGRTQSQNSQEVPRYPGIVDPAKEDLDLSELGPSTERKKEARAQKISWDSFFEIAKGIETERNMKSGKYEKIDKTFSEDEDLITGLTIKAGKPDRYFLETMNG